LEQKKAENELLSESQKQIQKKVSSHLLKVEELTIELEKCRSDNSRRPPTTELEAQKPVYQEPPANVVQAKFQLDSLESEKTKLLAKLDRALNRISELERELALAQGRSSQLECDLERNKAVKKEDRK
jgi:hypothetical protein